MNGNNLINSDEIIKNKINAEKKIGIYFLIKNEEIIYVGQTTNLHYRLGQHEGKKDYDSYYFIPCDAKKLDELEAEYIIKFNPLFNVNLPNSTSYKTLDYLKRKRNVNKWFLNRIIKFQNIQPVFRNYYNETEIEGFING